MTNSNNIVLARINRELELAHMLDARILKLQCQLEKVRYSMEPVWASLCASTPDTRCEEWERLYEKEKKIEKLLWLTRKEARRLRTC